MDIDRANQIINKMLKDRYLQNNRVNIDKILNEFLKYEKNGECPHFWPDENTACSVLISQKIAEEMGLNYE